MGNKIELFDYLGSRLGKLEFDELLLAGTSRNDGKERSTEWRQSFMSMCQYRYRIVCFMTQKISEAMKQIPLEATKSVSSPTCGLSVTENQSLSRAQEGTAQPASAPTRLQPGKLQHLNSSQNPLTSAVHAFRGTYVLR